MSDVKDKIEQTNLSTKDLSSESIPESTVKETTSGTEVLESKVHSEQNTPQKTTTVKPKKTIKEILNKTEETNDEEALKIDPVMLKMFEQMQKQTLDKMQKQIDSLTSFKEGKLKEESQLKEAALADDFDRKFNYLKENVGAATALKFKEKKDQGGYESANNYYDGVKETFSSKKNNYEMPVINERFHTLEEHEKYMREAKEARLQEFTKLQAKFTSQFTS